jgi:hypothetical protein
MFHSRSNSEINPAEPASTSDESRTAQTGALRPRDLVADSKPRIVEKRQTARPPGGSEIEAIDDRGRRWYQLRPDPRRRADLIGLNHTWSTVLAIVLIVSLTFPWW